MIRCRADGKEGLVLLRRQTCRAGCILAEMRETA